MNILKFFTYGKTSTFIYIALICFIFFGAGCINSKSGESEFIANPNVRFDPLLSVNVVNKYGSSSETELCEIVFSRTRDMQSPFKRFRLYKNNVFELGGFGAGDEFYIGAFIDLDSNLSPSFGYEPVGGAYAEEAISLCQPPEVNFNDGKKESAYKIIIKKDEVTKVELKMLRPITGRAPFNGALGLTTLPEFSWKAPAGINAFKITVYGGEKANAYWQALTYSEKIKYSILSGNNDYALIPAALLPADSRHKWSLIGYDSQNDMWAYAPGYLFLP
ncbi:MAG TPA: hypothetical protein PKW98_16835 [Candidatus Wallbacteria bacterium]|nr:MAG: hypothetical protein BWY32_00100 [bacterium ADurb.Bin243]HOD39715.1 hypothetical protein [Candidatus Wallbacteria bacterium]HPG59489.1 hypothetical protein [Candidatus Wallbacteria bacterium]